jgi:hypothetical protein
MGERKPFRDPRASLVWSHRIVEDLPVGRDPDKSKNRYPGDSYPDWTGKRLVPPPFRSLVKRRFKVVGMNEDVDIR